MSEATSTPELRPYTESIVDLSDSVLVPLEPSDPELTPYEDAGVECTVKRLPDFSILDDLPTAPKSAPRHDTLLPPASADAPADLPEVASFATEQQDCAPSPRTIPAPPQKASSLPPIPSPARRQPDSLPPIPLLHKKRLDPLPPISVLPKKKKKPRSLPPIAALPSKPPGPGTAMPLELPRAPATLEWALPAGEPAHYPEDNERTSVMPVAAAVERKTAFAWSRKSGLALAAGALLGLVVFLGFIISTQPAASVPAAASTDALLVTIAGPGGCGVASPQVFIDGVKRCESSPCLVPGLEDGLHFVTVTAPDYVTTSPRVVRVAHKEPALLHIDLAREKPALAAPEPATTTPVESLPIESSPPPATTSPAPAVEPPISGAIPAPAPAPPPFRPPAVVEAGAFLNLNSIPPSAVLVDGRPLGMTPKLNVAVKPGAHMVVFVHPEHGRRARAVTIDAGARQTVAMRF